MNFSQTSVSEIISHSALVLGRSACGFMPVKVGFMGGHFVPENPFFFLYLLQKNLSSPIALAKC